MKYLKWIAALSFIIVLSSSCLKIQGPNQNIKANERLAGDWDPVQYLVDGNDLSLIVQSLTFTFIPSELFPEEGKMIARSAGEQDQVQEYLITDEGKTIIIDGEENSLQVDGDVLELMNTVTDEQGKNYLVELKMIR